MAVALHSSGKFTVHISEPYTQYTYLRWDQGEWLPRSFLAQRWRRGLGSVLPEWPHQVVPQRVLNQFMYHLKRGRGFALGGCLLGWAAETGQRLHYAAAAVHRGDRVCEAELWLRVVVQF